MLNTETWPGFRGRSACLHSRPAKWATSKSTGIVDGTTEAARRGRVSVKQRESTLTNDLIHIREARVEPGSRQVKCGQGVLLTTT